MIAEPGENRGVSEVVGFILVFAVIISSVGLLYVTAFQSMHSYQEGEQVKSAAQGMEALSSNFNDVLHQNGTEQRSGELMLRDGTIRTGESGTTLLIDVVGTDYNKEIDTGSLTYQYDSSTIAYEGGGLFHGVADEPDQSVLASRPTLSCSDDRAIVSLLVLDSGNERSIQTSGNHRFTLVEDDLDKVDVESKTFSNANSVSIEVRSSPYASGWEDVFRGDGWSWSDGSSTIGTGSCNGLSTVVVRIVEATVEF